MCNCTIYLSCFLTSAFCTRCIIVCLLYAILLFTDRSEDVCCHDWVIKFSCHIKVFWWWLFSRLVITHLMSFLYYHAFRQIAFGWGWSIAHWDIGFVASFFCYIPPFLWAGSKQLFTYSMILLYFTVSSYFIILVCPLNRGSACIMCCQNVHFSTSRLTPYIC